MRSYTITAIALCIAGLVIPGVEAYVLYSRPYITAGLGIQRSTPKDLRTVSIGSHNGEIDSERTISDLLSGPRIDEEGRIINKKRKLYSYGSLEHVDDFFIGKYKVEWIVRGVKEKLRFRRRESGSPPLRTSRFTFAGIGGFIIRLWLDGLPESQSGHIALSLIQQEHWSSLNSPLYIAAGKVKRGPFFFRSSPYFQAIRSFCPLEDAVENNTLRLTIGLATRE